VSPQRRLFPSPGKVQPGERAEQLARSGVVGARCLFLVDACGQRDPEPVVGDARFPSAVGAKAHALVLGRVLSRELRLVAVVASIICTTKVLAAAVELVAVMVVDLFVRLGLHHVTVKQDRGRSAASHVAVGCTAVVSPVAPVVPAHVVEHVGVDESKLSVGQWQPASTTNRRGQFSRPLGVRLRVVARFASALLTRLDVVALLAARRACMMAVPPSSGEQLGTYAALSTLGVNHG